MVTEIHSPWHVSLHMCGCCRFLDFLSVIEMGRVHPQSHIEQVLSKGSSHGVPLIPEVPNLCATSCATYGRTSAGSALVNPTLTPIALTAFFFAEAFESGFVIWL